MTVMTEEQLTRIEGEPGNLLAVTHSGARIEADQVLLAIGRRPNTNGLGLETAGVELDPTGAVICRRIFPNQRAKYLRGR